MMGNPCASEYKLSLNKTILKTRCIVVELCILYHPHKARSLEKPRNPRNYVPQVSVSLSFMSLSLRSLSLWSLVSVTHVSVSQVSVSHASVSHISVSLVSVPHISISQVSVPQISVFVSVSFEHTLSSTLKPYILFLLWLVLKISLNWISQTVFIQTS